MTAPTLRPYQEQAILDVKAALRRTRRVVLQAPTGSGKTLLTAHMIRGARERGRRSWFAVHRRELLKQTSGALWDLSVPHGKIVAGNSQTMEEVQVASVQTLVRRLDKLIPPDMLILDEAHHSTSPTYRKIVDHCQDSWIIGLTATPCRTDGSGLDDIFHELVRGPELATLIEEGYLSRYRIIAPPRAMDMTGIHTRAGDFAKNELEEVIDKATITGDAVTHYRKYVSPRTCLVYCVSRKHARHVEAAYRAAGLDALYVAGDTPRAEREAAITGFRKGRPAIIVSVDLFGEGLDVPGLGSVQLLRPTQSLGLHLQMIGRSLRIEEGKDAAIILDHVGNSWRHGLPCDRREWTLEGRKRKKSTGEEAIGLRHCPECFAIYRAVLAACPLCGAVAVKAGPAPPEVVDGELTEIDAEEHRRKRAERMEQGQTESLEDLVRIAIEQGRNPGWAGHVFASRKRNKIDRKVAVGQAYRIARGMKVVNHA